MKDLRIIIVDDEPLAIDVIVNYLQRLDIRDITRCENGIDAFRLFQREVFDLLFLDLEMPQLRGFDLLKSLAKRPLVVISTAYRDYAVEGFEWEVLDYLVKPFSFPRFLQTMERVRRAMPGATTGGEAGLSDPAAGEDAFVFLKTDRQWVKVAVDGILYLESLKDYVRVVTETGEYIVHQPLADMTEKLPGEKFLRVHRSYTLALHRVERVRHHCAHIGNKVIPISRAHREELYRRLDGRGPGP